MSRRPSPPESLDLLLDTICNAFGGVVFLAILVVVLLQMTSPGPRTQRSAKTTASQLLELRTELAQLTEELKRLQDSGQFLDLSRSAFADDTKATLLATLRDLRSQRDRLEDKVARVNDEIAHRLADVDQTNSELARLDESAQEAKTELAQAVAKLKSELRSRTRGAELPVLRRSTKSPIAAIVRYGRFYVWHRYDSFGIRLGLNADEFVILEDSLTTQTVTPKPYAGIPIEDNDSSRQLLIRRLAQFSPDEYYIDIGVWPDSFEAFECLRHDLVDQGYEYSILPITEDGSLNDRGGEFRGVQ